MVEAKRKHVYDYIVIGTGPAGAVLAKVLSDDKSTSVLVLEAGDNNDLDLPIRNSTFALELEEHFFAKYFWQGEGIPQKGVDDRSFEWTTGRLAGGGSSINGEQYVRPTNGVFREWQALLGPIWSPQRAIARFKRLENYHGQTENHAARGFRGRIDIRQAPTHPTVMAEKLVSAIERATGFPEILDYNDPFTPLGPFLQWQLYQQPSGRRESASTAFLAGTQGQSLQVLYESTATRILFAKKRAIGVEFLRDGKCLKAFARKKVIVSAGVNSAHLLQLSGIGPQDLLRKAGIPVIFNNPNVGKYLRNHTLNTAVFQANPQDAPLPTDDPNALYTGGAFLPDPTPGADQERRAVQLIGIGSSGSLSIAILYLRPKSRGSIRLQNKDPLKIVLADEGFLANEDDLVAVRNIYKTYILQIARELESIDPTYQLISPSMDVLNDDDQLDEFIKQNFGHNHHQQGSLRMGPLKKGGVVDRLGNVYGVKNLIVADASIIPFTVDGNTSAAAFLIGLTIGNQLKQKKLRKKQRLNASWDEE